MPNFSGPEGDLSDIFLSDTNILERYVGNQLWLWGGGTSGQLGDNTSVDKSSPVQTVSGGTNWVQVSISGHSAAIKTDNTLWLWGSNGSGQLGDNTRVDKSSPVQTVSGGTNWKQVSCGPVHAAAIKTDGTLWMWGDNTNGQLGDNTVASKSSPVQTVSGGTNWKQVSTSGSTYDFTAAIKTDGTLWMWGENNFGQLGDNSITDKSSPVQTVSGGTNWKQVSCGSGHTSAIKTDGTLWSWGSGTTGTMGNNAASNRSSPVQTISGGTNWKQVSAGTDMTAAVKTDGTLWLWGAGAFGVLGNNAITNRSSPVQTVSAGTNWKQVDAGDYIVGSVKTDGSLWTWGLGTTGQLGDNSVTSKSSPVQTVAGGTNWKQVVTGSTRAAAVTYTES